MTGLDPSSDRILEVAALVTDFEFKELGSLEVVIKQDALALENMDEFVRDMHTKNGLLDLQRTGVTEDEATNKLLALIEAHWSNEELVILGGNSIHMDRKFIDQWWPSVADRLHYRMLDVTAWKVFMQGRFNDQYEKKEAHRALGDIQESIAELKYYLGKLHG